MAKSKNITDERAARRYHQMAMLERVLSLKVGEIAAASEHLKELKKEHDGLVMRLRASARDEGELPLFDLDGD